jgi:molybdopterin-biosynthesis enzyme MoeA-like protein
LSSVKTAGTSKGPGSQAFVAANRAARRQVHQGLDDPVAERVPIDTAPRALAILYEWVKTTGAEMNRGASAHDAHPQGEDLILDKVSRAPGFWIGNVIVMAGVPSIMQAMLDEAAPKLKIGVRVLSETVRADTREGDIGMQLGEIAKANPAVAIRSYQFFDPRQGANTNVLLHRSSRLRNARSRICWSECGEHDQNSA